MTDTVRIMEMPTFPELVFEDEQHIYRLNDHVIPSVSEVMTPISDARYKNIRRTTLDKAANKGSAVHEAIEFWTRYQIEDIEPKYRGYFEAFLRWFDKEKPVVIGSENRIYHPVLEYGGTLDYYCYTGDWVPTLIDFKCTSELSDMSCRVQLEAYAQAVKSFDLPVERKNILHLKDNGSYEYRPYEAIDPTAWRVFGGLKCLYDYLRSYDKN